MAGLGGISPFSWQLRDLATLRDNDYTGLVAIEAGGGKTLTACLAIKEAQPDVVLITAPDSTINRPYRNWPKTVGEVCDREVRRIGKSNKAERAALTDFEMGRPGVYATTPQFASRKTTDRSMWAGDMWIVDESHMGSTPGKTTQRAFSGFYPSDDPLNEYFDARLALSGTYYRHNFENAWSTMRLLWPELNQRGEVADDNYYAWLKTRMESEQVYTAQRDQYGNAKQVTNYTVEKNPGTLLSQMPCAIVHKRRERCCDSHPNGFLTTEEPLVIDREVDLTRVQTRAIMELEEHYMTFLDENPLITDLSIVQKQRIRQVCLGEPTVTYDYVVNEEGEEEEKVNIQFADDCNTPFVDETISILEELPENEPVVVFLEAQRFAHVVIDRLNKAGFKAAEYSGKVKSDLDVFGTDYQVLVAVTSAVGVGTDGIQRNCQTEIWLETPVSLTNQTQAFARLDRMGGRQVQRYIVKDHLGYAEGKLSDLLQKRLRVNESMRKVG